MEILGCLPECFSNTITKAKDLLFFALLHEVKIPHVMRFHLGNFELNKKIQARTDDQTELEKSAKHHFTYQKCVEPYRPPDQKLQHSVEVL